MPWPLSQDYNEAIQNPAVNFTDADLRAGEPVRNALGLPVPCSGNFADVYQVRNSTRSWAVKCFTREVPGLRERYVEIGDYLQKLRLPCMVAFQYLDSAIRTNGPWYPVVKMDWVEGFTLNDFVKQNLDKPLALQSLAESWVFLARFLRETRLAHGDLQHGNVLLVPGETFPIKLVDYDGMFVPALARKPSGEVGHPAYQHPQRLREGIYSADVDRFPLLVVYCAIRALMVGGSALWERYDNGDNLLFREEDLRSPRNSALFWDLVRLNDPDVRRLADCLSRAVYKPLEQTPLLEELVEDSPAARSIAAAKFASHISETSARTAEQHWSSAPPPIRLRNPQPTTRNEGSSGLASATAIPFNTGLTPMGITEQRFEQATADQSGGGMPFQKRTTLVRPLVFAALAFLCCLVPSIVIVMYSLAQKIQYLSDLPEFGVKVAEQRFAKHGNLGYAAGNPPSSRIKVNGREYPNGLSMCPASNTHAAAKYTLGKTASTFMGSVALNDSAGAAGLTPGVGKIPTPLTFQVIGDGKLLWSSKPVDVAGNVQECKVDVTRVDVLELRVDCPGSGVNAQAVWLEPRVLLR